MLPAPPSAPGSAFKPRFLRALPFGACVAVDLPAEDEYEIRPALHPEEVAYARGLSPARRVTWVGGRLALRAALESIGAVLSDPILATHRGAPALPPGFAGSISHKRELAVALAARAEGPSPFTLGIDVEVPAPLRQDIARHVLTPDERTTLDALEDAARNDELLRRFAAKEAVYKALDPWVQRFVSFQEVAIIGHPDRHLEARLSLKNNEGPFAVELHDAGDDALILIAARVVR